MKSVKRVVAVSQFLLLVLVVSFSALAAGQLDTSFKTYLTNSGGGFGNKALILPDGKILVSVRTQVLNGFFVGDLVRLNADGTIDTSFNPPDFTPPGPNARTIAALAVQPDGKILVGGTFTYVNGEERHSLARLNSDGSLDATFPNVYPNVGSVVDIVIYPDGRLLVGGNFNPLTGPIHHLTRMSANGVVDPSFDYQGPVEVRAFVLQPDGKVVVAENLSLPNNWLPRVRRYNDNGSLDATFTEINVQIDTGIAALEYLQDGKILVGGWFTTVNGTSRVGIFRANSDGTVDATFQDPGLNAGVQTIEPDTNGKFFIAGNYSQIGGAATSRKIHRLNADGTRDTGFSFFDSSIITVITDVEVQPDGKVIVISHSGSPISRATSNGSSDASFARPVPGDAAPGYATLVLPDNKILIGGRFASVNSVNRGCLAKLNPDGTLDTSFTASLFCGSFSYPLDLELQPDGKILAAGQIGGARRLNADGSADVIFPGTDSGTWDIEYLPDSKILVAGGTLKRFNSNGTLDATLATVAGAQFPNIFKMAVQPDGKTIIVGHFTTVNGQTRNRIARINTDGTIDSSFNAQADTDISTVALLPDGKILIGGGFTSVNSDLNKRYFVRLNSNGSVDSSFSAALDGPVLGMKIQADGRILIGGAFATIDGVLTLRIGRLNQNGSRDTSFNAGSGPNSTVWSIDQQSDGKIVYAGEFTKTDGRSTLGVGRLLNAPPSKFFDYDGDGKADISVFRPSENKWYILRSSDLQVDQPVFAIAGDIPVPADYDGDRKTDVAIFRPSNGQWWYKSSIDGSQVLNQLGQAGDVPRPSDFDGDGKTDLVLFRPSANAWIRFGSLAGSVPNAQFGSPGDQPVIGDFDGDGKSDLAVFRPSTGDWWYAASSAGGQFRQTHWGQNGDLPVPADYDGDSKTDFAVFRPSDGGWYIYNSGNGSFTTTAFGTSGDRPAAADYDGDGRADISVFRPSTGIWYLLRSTSGFAGAQFGISTDTPTPGAFVP
ncbi:MAG TPA: FG-GAP-like repeat-containing protein [Pyrinomonadaceae bacterium]|nr:FG-GAP-like repeat-containing protein [Pyrinomonadaceae bacterium]